MQCHVLLHTHVAKCPVTRKCTHLCERPAIAHAHVWRQQPIANTQGGVIKQLLRGILEATHFADRFGIPHVAVQDGFDIQHRAQRRTQQTHAGLSFLACASAHVMKVLHDEVTVRVVYELLNPRADFGRLLARSNHLSGLDHRHSLCRENVLGIDDAE